MRPLEAKRDGLFGGFGDLEYFDGARPLGGSEWSMSGSAYVRELLVAARRRMERHLSLDRSQPSPGRWPRTLSEQFAHWWAGFTRARRRVKRWDVTAPPASASKAQDETNPGPLPIFDVNNVRLRRALAALQPEDSQLLMMRHVDHTSTDRIAAALGMTEKEVKTRLVRALLRLRERMES